jgi:hypothetical protein
VDITFAKWSTIALKTNMYYCSIEFDLPTHLSLADFSQPKPTAQSNEWMFSLNLAPRCFTALGLHPFNVTVYPSIQQGHPVSNEAFVLERFNPPTDPQLRLSGSATTPFLRFYPLCIFFFPHLCIFPSHSLCENCLYSEKNKNSSSTYSGLMLSFLHTQNK